MSNGMLMQKCAPKQAGPAAHEGHQGIDPSLIGAALGQGLFPELYTNTDDYIRDIRGHGGDGR